MIDNDEYMVFLYIFYWILFEKKLNIDIDSKMFLLVCMWVVKIVIIVDLLKLFLNLCVIFKKVFYC